MKAIRTYEISDGYLRKKTTFLPDEDSLDDPMQCMISVRIDPDVDGIPVDGADVLLIPYPADLPLDLKIQEMQHFLNTLNQMFYGT